MTTPDILQKIVRANVEILQIIATTTDDILHKIDMKNVDIVLMMATTTADYKRIATKIADTIQIITTHTRNITDTNFISLGFKTASENIYESPTD